MKIAYTGEEGNARKIVYCGDRKRSRIARQRENKHVGREDNKNDIAEKRKNNKNEAKRKES
jgi:hypothetical protein